VNPDYQYIADIAAEMAVPADGILSRTLYTRDGIKAVLFGFSPGQELSEHTAATTAIIQIIRGEAQVTLGEATFDAQAGAFIHMAPRLRHALVAKTELVMLLLLIKT
jgi:quercetin dioxygenase-like cupin family protein